MSGDARAIKLTVRHDKSPKGSKVHPDENQGWLVILSGLKSLLETGKPLPEFDFMGDARKARDEMKQAAKRIKTLLTHTEDVSPEEMKKRMDQFFIVAPSQSKNARARGKNESARALPVAPG